ncbi:MAG: hypothetical protein IJP86_04675 [Synergistaceae bacterium]|nr:hypothetical protein [Synergistaceae bacterium]
MKKKAAVAVMLAVILPLCARNGAVLTLWGTAAALWGVNEIAAMRMRRQVSPFSPKSEIRNVHTLIISDMIAPEITGAKTDFLQIFAPGRSLQSCYEILRHTHSILDDKGGACVIFAVKEGNSEGFSVFDIPFFHKITLRKHGLRMLRRLSGFPAFVSPLRAFLLAAGMKGRNYREISALPEEAASFCRERGYSLRMFTR